jgi:hypothetical protein
MVYGFLLPRETMIIEKHEDITAIPLSGFNTLFRMNPQHHYIGIETMKEIAESWYQVTAFSIASCSLVPRHNPTNPAVVNDFLSRDRWGWDVDVRQRVKHFRILANYIDHTGTSAAQLVPHLQQVATITSRKARIEIQFTPPYFLIFRNPWKNLWFLLQGFSMLLVRLSLPYFIIPHAYVYIAALLHRYSINSVLHFRSPLYVRQYYYLPGARWACEEGTLCCHQLGVSAQVRDEE